MKIFQSVKVGLTKLHYGTLCRNVPYPLFAIVPLEYGDYSGLDDLDTELIHSFIDANFPHGYLMDIRDADNPFFCSHPDIGGLAAEVVEADFYHA